MRASIRASHHRILALGASVLIFGSALAAAAMPAQAADNIVTLTDPGVQVTNPLTNAVDLPITVSETDQTVTLSILPGNLPAGLSISQPAGPGDSVVAITGTITAPFSGDVTIQAVDPDDATATDTVTFPWNADTIAVTNPGTQSSPAGAAVAPLTITASDASARTLAYAAVNLPTGLTINATSGTISGTPTVAGAYPVTVTASTATDLDLGVSAPVSFTWNVVAVQDTIKVTVPTPEKVYLRINVKVQPKATDSDPGQKLTWSASPAQPLPTGLSISPETGLISGRPTVLNGPPTSVVVATDATGSTGSATIKWVVTIDGYLDFPGPESVTVGQGKDLVLKEADYVPGDKMTWKAIDLPSGMGLKQSPLMIYGWPTQAGTKNVNIQGYGTLGARDWMTFKLVVKPATGKGATGQIRLALDGKCLQDPGSKTASGTHVAIAACAAGAAERWTIASDGTLRVNRRCLDIAGTGGVSGKQLQLVTCGNGNARQLWLQGTDGELVNPPSGLCVTDQGASEKNGAVPVMGACQVKSAKQWTLPAQPVLTALGGSCADDHFSAGNNGAIVDMFWCNGTTGQAWSFRPDGTIWAGLYGNACVTVRGKLGAVGTKIVLWGCSASDKGQKWTVAHTGNMSSELKLGGVCLGITSMTAGNATQLVTQKCTPSDPRVHWRIG